MTHQAGWMQVSEKGAIWGFKALVFLCTIFGRRVARFILSIVAFYYTLLSPNTYRASRDYLSKLHSKVTWTMVYRHVFCFSQVTLDRLFFAQNQIKLFQVSFHGEEHLKKLREKNQGALLILAHLGSFEAGRCFSETRAFRLNILGYFRNAQKINQTLEKLNPQINARLIPLTPENVGFAFQVQERIEAGELVATMGDRVGVDGKSATANFLGFPARFPTGPYQLAAVLGCPVFLAFGLYSEPNRYDLYCEPFAEKLILPRVNRQQALADCVQNYASRLEHYCRLAENNWFNFYPFWEHAHEG